VGSVVHRFCRSRARPTGGRPHHQPETPGLPWLAYVGNAGQSLDDTTRADTQTTNAEADNAANGIFFDNNRNPYIGPADGRGDGNDAQTNHKYPLIRMSLDYVQANDGQSKTLMLSENLHTWYWTYGAELDTTTGQYIQDDDPSTNRIQDRKHLFGFIWRNSPPVHRLDPWERINGDRYYDRFDEPQTMLDFAEGEQTSGDGNQSHQYPYEDYGYPSSNHPGGVNVAFCDGQVFFMNARIDPKVYAMLMTSNRNRSDFVDYEQGPPYVPDRKLPQPTEEDYR
jgi:prepilin-type processing-associated H-X9-DG protein